MEKVKNITIIVLCIITIWLLIDRYFIGNSSVSKSNETQFFRFNDTLNMASGVLQVAYLNIDSVLVEYEMAIKLNDDFTKKQRNSETEFAKKARAFEKDYVAFQEKAQRGGFLSQTSMELQQRDLLKQKESLEDLEELLTKDLISEQQRLNELLYKAIVEFVHSFNQDAKYDIIFTNTNPGAIMYGKPEYNITQFIIEGLNAEYRQGK